MNPPRTSATLVLNPALTWLMGLLPKQTLRRTLLASLASRVKGFTCDDDKQIQRINRMLNLSSRDDALKLPVLCQRLIWKATGPLPDTSSPARPTARSVVSALPAKLRYDDYRSMETDFGVLMAEETGQGVNMGL